MVAVVVEEFVGLVASFGSFSSLQLRCGSRWRSVASSTSTSRWWSASSTSISTLMVGSQWWQPGSTPRIVPLWVPEYSQGDVAALRRSPLWGDLVSCLKQSLKAHPRQKLSAHTSISRPVGRSPSLKECGLDTFLPIIGEQTSPGFGGQPSPAVGGQQAERAVGGNMYLQIDLSHALCMAWSRHWRTTKSSRWWTASKASRWRHCHILIFAIFVHGGLSR